MFLIDDLQTSDIEQCGIIVASQTDLSRIDIGDNHVLVQENLSDFENFGDDLSDFLFIQIERTILNLSLDRSFQASAFDFNKFIFFI